uniref:Coiled-coil domain-containing protein 12 n=1 Tax=Hyaloperonospora arabidopsidis (strain Emoy2) TaxID=559515 RepID=M4BKX1_HYAAE
MTGADDTIPRAKRLKLLREAKARKERGETNRNEAEAVVDAKQQPVEDDAKDLDVEQSTKVEDKTEESVPKVAQGPEGDVTNMGENSDDDMLNLAPKRANWDIERDIAPMLRKLERRTQHAIVEILREELAAQQLEGDSGTDEEANDDDEEEDEADDVDE